MAAASSEARTIPHVINENTIKNRMWQTQQYEMMNGECILSIAQHTDTNGDIKFTRRRMRDLERQ